MLNLREVDPLSKPRWHCLRAVHQVWLMVQNIALSGNVSNASVAGGRCPFFPVWTVAVVAKPKILCVKGCGAHGKSQGSPLGLAHNDNDDGDDARILQPLLAPLVPTSMAPAPLLLAAAPLGVMTSPENLKMVRYYEVSLIYALSHPNSPISLKFLWCLEKLHWCIQTIKQDSCEPEATGAKHLSGSNH